MLNIKRFLSLTMLITFFAFSLNAKETKEFEKLLLKIARDSINEKLTNQNLIDKEKLLKEYPKLAEKGAIFVTITKDKKLRGCIGSILPRRPLIEDLIKNAKSAAFADPRFSPLSYDEFNKIKIEVSILTIPTEVKYKSFEELKSKIKPFKDGVIITLDNKMATYLPQVWEQIPYFKTFFYELYLKAKIDTKYLKTNLVKVYIYQVEKYKEE